MMYQMDMRACRDRLGAARSKHGIHTASPRRRIRPGDCDSPWIRASCQPPLWQTDVAEAAKSRGRQVWLRRHQHQPASPPASPT
ncbi:uncharacterized protein UV8b_00200 [Ustilaginoidea virens]|uniref:Uncharacterized protein n=1 Tax=Ustilaginoidea virens TaxID=1159556 RepID=A0A8E5HJ98_USTVR|nr:uncharacterized protein UV8b_00200 [Ustilaginoidea virens]QUC15959.1 hypothetical protein UV8b_00200 [Ustilaginoidea virens]